MAVKVFVSLLLLVPVSGGRGPQSTLQVESSFEKKRVNSTSLGIIGHHGSVLAAQPKVQKTRPCSAAVHLSDWLQCLQQMKVTQMHFLLFWSGETLKAHLQFAYRAEGALFKDDILDWARRIKPPNCPRAPHGVDPPHGRHMELIRIRNSLTCMIETLRDSQFIKLLMCMTVEVQADFEHWFLAYTSDPEITGKSDFLKSEINEALEEMKTMLFSHNPPKNFQFQKGGTHPQVVDTADEMWSNPRSTYREWINRVKEYGSDDLMCGSAPLTAIPMTGSAPLTAIPMTQQLWEIARKMPNILRKKDAVISDHADDVNT